MKIKHILSAFALTATVAVQAQQVTISPIPQNISWGDKAYDSAGVTYTLQGADEADADAVRALKAKCQVTDGAGAVTIVMGERGDAAVAEYASEIPEHAEGYLLKVEPGRVVIAGHDGAGTFYGISVPFLSENPMLIFILPPGGFFTYGLLMAAVNRLAEKKGKPRAELRGCEACPMAHNCALNSANKKEEVAE